MQIERFEVKGFKNLRQSVVLDGLAGVNVIHGENNVGKSNLLQAMDLFFWLLKTLAQRVFATGTSKRTAGAGWVAPNETEWINFAYESDSLIQRGYPADDVFNVDSPVPIEWNVMFRVEAGDFLRAGLDDQTAGMFFPFRVRLARNTTNGVDASVYGTAPWATTWEGTRGIFRMIAQNFDLRTDASLRAFILVDTHRRVAAIDKSEQQDEMRRPVPSELLLSLYDAKESVEPGTFERWELFERSMNSLGPLVDDGRFVITYNRGRARAILALQKGRTRMPLEALGSGVQQLASLLARLLLGNSAIVAIEEPELNLRHDLQLRLHDILGEIVDSGKGPQQIILTSHSPAFETGDSFYAMTRTPDGPTVTRRPVGEAYAFTTQLLGAQPESHRAAYGYVSSEGLLRLSEKARKDLGVEHGGGVVTVKRESHPYVELLTDQQFHELMTGEDAGE